jgi:hypothetical protein
MSIRRAGNGVLLGAAVSVLGPVTVGATSKVNCRLFDYTCESHYDCVNACLQRQQKMKLQALNDSLPSSSYNTGQT